MSKKTKIVLLVIAIISIGFFRDYFFMNMNSVYKTTRGIHPYHARDEFNFMLSWSENTFEVVKWIGTFVFYGLFMLFTWLIVKVSFNNSFYNRITIYFYLSLMAISALMFGAGAIISSVDDVYDAVHTIMMFAQSFLPMLILVLIFKYFPISREDKS